METEKYGELWALLTYEENQSISNAMIDRYLRKEKGSIPKAVKCLESTLNWQEAYNVEAIRTLSPPYDSRVRAENSSGKIYVRGKDKEGRALMYMKPRLENTKNHEDNLCHVVFSLEKAVACSEREGREKINLVMDYNNYSLLHAPPLKTSRAVLNILQSHYPERLHRAYLINTPFVFRAFWCAIKPFIDPKTKEKIVFLKGDKQIVERLHGEFDVGQLEEWVGGERKDATECNGGFDSDWYLTRELSECYGAGRS